MLLVTRFIGLPKRFEVKEQFNVRSIFYSVEFMSGKLQKILDRFFQWFAFWLAGFYIKKYQPACIVASYPNLFFLQLGRRLSQKFNKPFVPYLHDTIAEGLAHTHLAAAAVKEQEICFRQAYKIAVMSKGMADLYKRKYGLDTLIWPHQFPDADYIPVPWEQKKLQAFWAGDVYAINGKSLKRVSDALGALNIPLLVSGPKPKELLASEMQITGSHVRRQYYPKRSDYLHAMSESKIVLLCIDWPDESTVHPDELSTIFPTKAIEFIHSQSFILVHCPEHYFLADLAKNLPGVLLIAQRDEEMIRSAISVLLDRKVGLPERQIRGLAEYNETFLAGQLVN